MKTMKIITPAAVLLAGALFAAPVFADVDVAVTLDKDKDITVTETITINKGVVLRVILGTGATVGAAQPLADLLTAAEARAIVNVKNVNNEVGPTAVTGTTEHNNDPDSIILRSINNNTGVVGVNQDTGDNNNQGNVVALALTDLANGFANSQAGGDQLNGHPGNIDAGNSVDERPGPLPSAVINTTKPTTLDPGVFTTRADMIGSVNGNTGVVGVNQNAGNMNNQHNLFALAVGLDPVYALAEGALGQENANNDVVGINTVKRSVIADSANKNLGIVGINQSVGNMNNQMTVVSVSAATASHTSFAGLLGTTSPL